MYLCTYTRARVCVFVCVCVYKYAAKVKPIEELPLSNLPEISLVTAFMLTPLAPSFLSESWYLQLTC